MIACYSEISALSSNNMLRGILTQHANAKLLMLRLLDFGITCVISSSFADIFHNNCFKNGILPITLDEEKIKELSEYANRKEEISVDLVEEKVFFGNNEIKFVVDQFKKKCLLEGLDEIALSLKKSNKIESFENNLKSKRPWVFND